MAKKNLPEKLRICIIAQKFPVLGRASDHGFLWPIAKGLADLGHEVTVIAGRGNTGRSEIVRDRVTAYYLFEGKVDQTRLPEAVFKKFLELHRKTPFDIVHGIDSSAKKIASHKKLLNVAIAYDADATQMSQLFSIMGMSQETVESLLTTGIAVTYKFLTTYFGTDRRILKNADGIFVSTPQQRSTLERYYLYPDYSIYTVPYGIELSSLEERTLSGDLRASLNIPLSAKIAVTFTDMNEKDEITHILKAFEKVAIKKPNAHLIVVGNGPVFKDIEYKMLQLALGRRVHLVGAVKEDEVNDYVSLSDAFINLSSKTTGFDPIMIEAMAQKKVVIGSEVSAIANIIEDSEDGFLLRPADFESLGDLLIDIFSESIPIQEIGEKARSKVISQFNNAAMISSTLSAYLQILVASGLYQEAKKPHNSSSNEPPQHNASHL